jgi:hypothetical protein
LLDSVGGRLDEFEVKRPRESAGDRVLRSREVGAIGVEPVSPEVRATFGVDQLHVHPNLVTSSSHATFEDIPNAQIAADLPHIDGFAFVGEGRVAGDHEASRNPREIGGQVICDAVGKILLVWIVREVGEGGAVSTVERPCLAP